MRLKLLLTLFLNWVAVVSIAQSSSQQQRVWTATEVKTWAEKNKTYSTWQGWILYQGSDTLNHYFISRITDNWQWFVIRRSDLKVPEEHAHKVTSSAALGYYYVDPLNDFKKVKDYK
jgi:hypothetical protein